MRFGGIRMKYCDAIKCLRKKLLLSQTEFAEKIEVEE